MAKLVGLIKPLIHIMMITISMGVIGFLCSIFITILGGFGLLNFLGYDTLISNQTIFILVILLAVLRGVLRYAEQASGHYIAFKLLALIRDKVFRALRRLAPAKLEGKEKGNLVSVITTDIELLEVFYAHTIAPIAIAIITSLLLIIFIGRYSVILGLFALLSYLIVGAVIPYINSALGREVGRVYRKEFGNLNSYVLDSLRGMKETIQYDNGKERLQHMMDQSKELDSRQEVLRGKEGTTKAVTDAAILLCSLGILLISIYLMSKGKVTFEGVLISFIALMSSFGPVVALSNLSNNLLQTLASGERVLAILEEEPILEEVTDGYEYQEKEGTELDGMKVESVSFAYAKEQILKNVSIDLPTHKIIGIKGRSGSGKSTLLKLLMRFWDVNDGTIELGIKANGVEDNKNIKTVNTSTLRNLQSYMTQETYLFHGTIRDNLLIGKLDASEEEVIAAAKKAAIHDFIVSLPNGYDTNIGELGSTLSGGERQRLGLARAFLHDAPFLFLDEPTSNLDSLSEGIILKSLKEECKDKTVVLVSHRESTMKIADQVYLMDSGRVS